MQTDTETRPRRQPFLRSARYGMGTLALVLACSLPASVRAAGDAKAGAAKFRASICVQCHGLEGQGVRTMGLDLRTAPLIRAGNPAAVAAFIASGHGATNKFPAGMPPDGGTSLTEEDRENIAAWLVTLPKSKSAD